MCVDISDYDQQCTMFLSQDSHPICLNYRSAKYTTMETISLLLTDSSDFTWSSDSIVSHLISCSQMRLSTRNGTRSPTPYNSHPPSLVDIVFLIEQSDRILNMKKLEHLELLIELSQNETHDVRFGVVMYSVFDPNTTKAIGFNRIFPFNEAKTLLTQLPVNEGVTQTDSKEVYQYTSLKRNLALISEVLKNNSSLKLRPTSDLYIISLLDLYTAGQSPKSTKMEKIAINDLKKNIANLMSILVNQATISQSNPLFLQFVFDASNPAASHNLGDPSLSSLYGDCSHFNKAATLKALLGSDSAQGNTLQAHFLSNGILSKTLTWKDLKRQECVHGLIPAISGHFQIYPTFKNSCHTHLKCHKCYCSPIHGWVNKDSNNRSGDHDELFVDRFPISTTFSANHEDLALVIDNRYISTKLPEEKLSIYSETRSLPKVTPTITGKPKVLQWNPNRAIAQEIIGRKEPLVLRNTVVHSWPALQKWNWSYISDNFGLDMLESVKCTSTYLTFDPDRRTPLKLNISIPYTTRNMTREEFFSCVNLDTKCADSFLGHYYFGSVPAKLKKDLLPDRFLYNSEKDYKSNRQFIWISSSGMITHTHFDQDFNLFVQLVGKKRFTLWNTFQHELMYTYPRIHPMWHKSQVNYKDVDTQKFPVFTKAKAVQIELGPGDMLYVPPYTWHYVETLSPSVSLSTWSHDYNVYDHMNAIYQHDHKFDLIKDPRGESLPVQYVLLSYS